jgi:hypothetical protein
MTMQHIARSFKVSLSIRHPYIDPVEISKALGLKPERATRAGMPRTTPLGDPLHGTYEFSHWMHHLDTEGVNELGSVLEDFVNRFQRHDDFFYRVVEDGGTVELFCGVFAAGNWDEVLPHSLMGQLAALRVDLRLDIYPKDDDAGPGATGELT